MNTNELAPIKTEIFARIERGNGDVEILKGHNLITTAGKTYYAKMACGESIGGTVTDPDYTSSTNCEATWTDGVAAISASNDYSHVAASSGIIQDSGMNDASAIIDSGYPQTDDGDSNNPGTPGAAVVTYRFNWPSGAGTDFSGAKDIVIHHKDATGATHDLLCHAEVDSGGISKGTSDSLTVYVNHTFA